MPIKFVSGANPSLVIGAQFGAAQQKQYADAERAQLLSEQRKQDEKEMFEYRLTAQQKADQARYQTALYQLDTNNDFNEFEKEEARRRIMSKMAGIQPLPMRKDPSKYPKGQGVGETWMDPHTGALVTRGTDENIKKIADDPTAISFADYAKLQAQLTKDLTVSTDPTKPPTPPDPAVVQAKMKEIMASYQQAIGSKRAPGVPAPDQAGGAEAPTLPQPVGSGRKPVRGEPQGLRVDGGAFVPAQAAPQGPPPPPPASPQGQTDYSFDLPGVGRITPIGAQVLGGKKLSPEEKRMVQDSVAKGGGNVPLDLKADFELPTGLKGMMNKYRLSDALDDAQADEDLKTQAFEQMYALERAMKGKSYRDKLRAYHDYNATIRNVVRKASKYAPERYKGFFE